VLAKLAQRCRVHLINLPGYGEYSGEYSENAQTPPADNASFLLTARHLVSALPAGVTLCGWSLGSLLALQATLLAPQHIARLILVGATPRFTQRDDWSPAQTPALLDSFSAALDQDTATTLQRFIALLNQGDAHARTITRALLAQMSKHLPAKATLSKGLSWLRDIDLRAQIPLIDAPTLLIHGERDPLMPLAAAQWLKQHLPQARLEVFAKTAHAPFLAEPEHFATLVGDFCHAAASA
jgi:pimeloyl-[acyl-carrier protein] methyl ester esterase